MIRCCLMFFGGNRLRFQCIKTASFEADVARENGGRLSAQHQWRFSCLLPDASKKIRPWKTKATTWMSHPTGTFRSLLHLHQWPENKWSDDLDQTAPTSG